MIGAPDVPVGSYTQEVLDRLDAPAREAILANVRSEESDVKAIVGKLVQGAADAGFVYLSDVAAAPELNQISSLPSSSPTSSTASASSKGRRIRMAPRSSSTASWRATAPTALAEAGFEPPPGG